FTVGLDLKSFEIDAPAFHFIQRGFRKIISDHRDQFGGVYIKRGRQADIGSGTADYPFFLTKRRFNTIEGNCADTYQAHRILFGHKDMASIRTEPATKIKCVAKVGAGGLFARDEHVTVFYYNLCREVV